MKGSKATGLALLAILLWSTLALAGNGLKDIPRFLLLGVTFLTSGLVSGLDRQGWQVPSKVFVVGVGGIFGYHLLYFTAFTKAPAVEVNLLNYLWPLLILLFSPVFIKGSRLHTNHIIGASLGLVGAGLIATGGKLNMNFQYLDGYVLAAVAAVIWAVYSLATKRLSPFPTRTVGAFLLISGILSMAIFFAGGGSYPQIAAVSPRQWLFLVLVGIGPMGAAFFLWDAALKNGDPRTIGSLAYLTPLLSTLNLMFFAGQKLTSATLIAMILIITGAVIGSRRGVTPKQGSETEPGELNA